MEKRKDKKGRILRDGESQRSDGRYMYRYRDLDNEVKCVYSWRLDKNDKVPLGKPQEVPLRELEKIIAQNTFNDVFTQGGECTVLELVEKYIGLKNGVRESTKVGYNTVINLLKKEKFGKKRIDEIRLSDAETWLVKLQQKDGKGYSSIHAIRGVLRPAFQMAVNDRILVHNPFEFPLSTVIVNDSVTRDALSHKDDKNFMEFMEKDKHYSRYYDGVYVIRHTGMRISEFCGLIVEDVDFDNMQIHVQRQMNRTRDMRYFVEYPKTKAGNRFIPMSKEVAEALKRIIKKRPAYADKVKIDGVSGFLTFDKNRMPRVAQHWEKYIQRAVEKHNEKFKAELPQVTPHVLRHTFCSRMASKGMNPKTLQYIMGHSDISVTLGIYTHLTADEAKKEFDRVS